MTGRNRKKVSEPAEVSGFRYPLAKAFNDAWHEFGDAVSTEFLIQITADRNDVDYGDVVEALAAEHGED